MTAAARCKRAGTGQAPHIGTSKLDEYSAANTAMWARWVIVMAMAFMRSSTECDICWGTTAFTRQGPLVRSQYRPPL